MCVVEEVTCFAVPVLPTRKVCFMQSSSGINCMLASSQFKDRIGTICCTSAPAAVPAQA